MRKILVTFLLFFSSCLADTIDLGSHGILSIDVPKEWKLSIQPIPDHGYAAAVRPLSGANAGIKLSIIYVPEPKPLDPEKLQSDLLRVCDHYVTTSVEQKKNVQEFGVNSGFGKYCIFTDAALVGKPEQKGEFKFIAPGLVQLTDDVVIVVTLVGDDPSDALAAEMFKIVKSTRITAAK